VFHIILKVNINLNVVLWLFEWIWNKILFIHSILLHMTTDIKKEFGKRVRYYRKLKHLTQSELSYKISKTEETISNIERGITESGIHLIEELASALGIQIRDFFNEDDIITPYLDKEKLELSREVIRLLGLKSKRYIKSIITILDEK